MSIEFIKQLIEKILPILKSVFLQRLNDIQIVDRIENDNPDEYKETRMKVTPKKKDVLISINHDELIRKKYKKGFIKNIRKESINEIVIHGTGGGKEATSLLRYVYNGEKANLYNQGVALFHYAIGQKGEIVEVIDPKYYVYHSTSGRHDKRTIGIELMNPSKVNDETYTQKQYESLFNLIFNFLILQFPTITQITSHKQNILTYNSKRGVKKYLKECPGNFDWKILDQYLENHYNFNIKGNLRYNLEKKNV